MVDYAVRVRVAADGRGVDLSAAKMSMNPFCEIAVEEAVRIKEKSPAAEVVALSIGPKACQETLRTALAIGADRAVHVLTDLRADQALQPLAVAKLFRRVVEREKADLVLLGKQSIDGDNCQTGAMLAGLLGWPQATFAAKVELNDKELLVECESDAGTEVYRLSLPCVVTADLRLNQPRYATLPSIMKAKKKPLEVVEAAALEADLAPRNEVLRVSDPPARPPGKVVQSVDDLIAALRKDSLIP